MRRKKFKATFVRLGKKMNYKGYSEETLLLKNIIDQETNRILTDHVWLNYTKAFEKISLKEGTVLEFEARIKKYRKGYVNRKYGIDKSTSDFRLSHPTKIRVIE